MLAGYTVNLFTVYIISFFLIIVKIVHSHNAIITHII